MRSGDDKRTITYVRKQAYIQMSVKLYKALVPKFDEHDAYKTAEDEWREDNKGKKNKELSINEKSIVRIVFEARVQCQVTGGKSAEETLTFHDEV